MSAVGAWDAAGREARRWVGSAIVAAHLPGQRSFPFRPRERIEARRDAAVRRIVAHAVRTVPFYRDLFARERVDPRDVRGAADLDRLPLLSREQVRREPELFRSTAPDARDALPFVTSGSSGTPFEVRHDRRSVLANIAHGERERQPVIALCGGSFRPREVHVGYETSNFKQVLRFYDQHTRLPRPARTSVSMVAPFEEIVASIERVRPDVLTAYGSFVDLYFRRVAARGAPVHLPRVVMYVGESLPRESRVWIEGRFGVRVLSRYCAAEAFKIGFFCEHATGFHLHEDLSHLRIVDPSGAPCAPGTSGEVVLSNLLNRATVLLNYPMGDRATLSTERCPCRRNLRLLSELEGRVEDPIRLDGGESLHPRAVWAVLRDDPAILQYQLVQHTPASFELKLDTVDAETFRRSSARAIAGLTTLLGANAEIRATHQPDLGRRERAATGKFRAVESHCRVSPAIPP